MDVNNVVVVEVVVGIKFLRIIEFNLNGQVAEKVLVLQFFEVDLVEGYRQIFSQHTNLKGIESDVNIRIFSLDFESQKDNMVVKPERRFHVIVSDAVEETTHEIPSFKRSVDIRVQIDKQKQSVAEECYAERVRKESHRQCVPNPLLFRTSWQSYWQQ